MPCPNNDIDCPRLNKDLCDCALRACITLRLALRFPKKLKLFGDPE